MVSKIWLVNLALIVCIVFLGITTLNGWTITDNNQETKVIEKKEDNAIQSRVNRRNKKMETAYNNIVGKNLFSPERKKFVPEEFENSDGSTKENKDSEKNIILYGVVMADKYKKALVYYPESGKNKWMSKGENIGSLTIAEISEESLLLTEGTNVYTISLYEGKNRKANESEVVKKDSGKSSSTLKIVNKNKEPAPEPAPVFGPIKKHEPKNENTKPVDTSNLPKIIPIFDSAKKVEAVNNMPDITSPKKDEEEIDADQEYEILKTPFGNLKVKKK